MGCISIFQTVDLAVLFACASTYADPSYCFVFFNTKVHALTAISILLFIGAVGKSAQIGLHTWLKLTKHSTLKAVSDGATNIVICWVYTKLLTVCFEKLGKEQKESYLNCFAVQNV
jgi:hypothetical protein